jgi:hypothetical protein
MNHATTDKQELRNRIFRASEDLKHYANLRTRTESDYFSHCFVWSGAMSVHQTHGATVEELQEALASVLASLRKLGVAS